jgi:hypothetical protein
MKMMMMMIRGGTRKHITSLSTTTKHPTSRGATTTIPRGQIMVEPCRIPKHSIHGDHRRRVP